MDSLGPPFIKDPTPFTLDLKPTFPLDKRAIEQRVTELGKNDPTIARINRVCLVAGLCLGGLGAVVFPPPIGLALGAILFFGVQIFGASQKEKMRQSHSHQREAEAVQSLILQSNAAQDQQLFDVQSDLMERHLYGYASALGKFIILKQRIETTLHQESVMADTDQKVDNLVDRICAIACDHLYDIAELDHQIAKAITSNAEGALNGMIELRARLLRQVERAYSTLCDCIRGRTDLEEAIESHPEIQSETEAAQIEGMETALHEFEIENRAMQRTIARAKSDLNGYESIDVELDRLIASARRPEGAPLPASGDGSQSTHLPPLPGRQ